MTEEMDEMSELCGGYGVGVVAARWCVPIVEDMAPSKSRSGLKCMVVGRSASLIEVAWSYSLNSLWLTNQRPHRLPPHK